VSTTNRHSDKFEIPLLGTLVRYKRGCKFPEKSMTPVTVVSTLNSGGTERVALNLHNQLIEVFPNSLLIVLLATVKPADKIQNVIYLDGKNVFSSIINFLALYRKIKYEKKLVIFSFSEYSNSIISLLKTCKFINGPVILRASTVLTKKFEEAGRLRKRISTLLYASADVIVCQSETIRSDFIERFKIPAEKLVIIHNPALNSQDYRVRPANHEDYDLSNSKPYVVCVGNMRKEKGQARLVELYKKSGCRHNLVFAGSGAEADRLARIVDFYKLHDRIKIIGGTVDTIPLIAGAKALIIPSYYEGYPNVAVDAAFLGIPIIGFSDCEVLSEIVSDGVNGYICNYSEPNSFVIAVERSCDLKPYNPQTQLLCARHQPKTFLAKYLQVAEKLSE